MAYCDKEDLLLYIDTNSLDELTAGDDTLLLNIINDVGSLMNSLLFNFFTIPFSVEIPILKMINCKLAICRLYERASFRNSSSTYSNNRKNSCKETMDLLNAIPSVGLTDVNGNSIELINIKNTIQTINTNTEIYDDTFFSEYKI